jgi:ribosomal protein S18 acetylase RimI-like enzyme
MSRLIHTTATIPEVTLRKKILGSSLDLYEKLFGYGEKPRKYLEMELRDGVSEIAVIYDSETLQVSAFCVFYRRTLSELFIDYLGVSPTSQGGGIGSRLLREVLDYSLRIEGLREVSLLCSEDKVPFYKKFGFENTGQFADLSGTWYRLSRSLHA